MKSESRIVKLVFGGMGAIYALVGVVCLMLAVHRAGALTAIFTLPEDDLALSIIGCVFTLLGVIFLAVGVAFALADKRRARLREELLVWGSRVQGTVMEVYTDHTIRVNHRSPVIAKVRCAFPTGEVTLKSPRLWGNPPAVGDQLDVLFDPMDEKRYVIDLKEGT